MKTFFSWLPEICLIIALLLYTNNVNDRLHNLENPPKWEDYIMMQLYIAQNIVRLA